MPSVGEGFTQSYPAVPESVARARHRLTDFAGAAGADERQIESVRLASSEALTNAVLHAYPGDEGQIHVTAAVVADEVWVLIADDGCGLQPRADRPGLGVGLGLIAQLSDHLAIASRASGGTEVRMRFTLVGPEGARATPARAPRGRGAASSRRVARESA